MRVNEAECMTRKLINEWASRKWKLPAFTDGELMNELGRLGRRVSWKWVLVGVGDEAMTSCCPV